MSEVLLDVRGPLGVVTLNRPQAINALTHGMVRTIDAALRRWAADDTVRAVVLRGAGERGLCAGGDIVAIHDEAKAAQATGTPAAATALFWRQEYTLNALIGRYPKPYVALMDGIVMGGGVGLAAHGNTRVVTERTVVAMPEVGIGFVPDVGGTYLLGRAPGQTGAHVALATARMTAGDALACGFADWFVPSADLPDLLDALAQDPTPAAVARLAHPAPASDLLAQRGWIDPCYSADTVEGIVARLRDHGDPAAAAAARQILAKSPTALKVALRSLRHAGAQATLEEALNEEYRVSTATLASPDLVEGIRAQVVDKDRAPRWRPARLEDVTDAAVDTYFADLGPGELGLTPPPEGHP